MSDRPPTLGQTRVTRMLDFIGKIIRLTQKFEITNLTL